jgi:DNA-binding Lrp family transcriptional regulator
MYDEELLSGLERELLPVMESGFPVTATPYEALASAVGSTEAEVLAAVRDLEDRGVIRRVGPIFEPRRLGYVSTLVGITVADDELEAAASSIADCPQVIHGHVREGDWNVWFAVAAPSQDELDEVVFRLAQDAGATDVLNVPAKWVFKSKVEIGAAGGDGVEVRSLETHPSFYTAVELDDEQRALVGVLQRGLPTEERPFAAVAVELGRAGFERDEAWIIGQTAIWMDEGVIRKFGASVRPGRAGYGENVLAVWECPAERVEEVGRLFARQAEVDRCYEREPQCGWPYSLYTTLHAVSRGAAEDLASKMTAESGLPEPMLLPSVRRLKEFSMRYFPDEGC